MAKYIAVETDISMSSNGCSEFEKNDTGVYRDTPQEAWDVVSGCFYGPCTVILCTKGYIHNNKVKGMD